MGSRLRLVFAASALLVSQMCDGVAQGSSAAADVAAIRAQARAETIPVVIFLPGILGSELRKGSKSLWGDLGIPRGLDEDIAYDEGIKLDVRLLERFSAWLMALKNIYGTTFAGISAAAALKGSNAWAFSYDWRQSNRTSAKELTEFLCKLSPELKKRPILFYAHSMGGLVLKNWLKHEYRDRKLCPATQITVVDALGRIDGMVFVGTPPRLVQERSRKFFSLSLNEYGGTFPSLYELLPAPMECSPVQKASAENLRKRDAADGKPAVTDIGDVFHFQIWKNYGWPKNLYRGNFRKKEKFVGAVLEDYLARARKISCDLAEHPWDKENIPIVRVYSTKWKTVCKVTVVVPDHSGISPEIVTSSEGSLCDGDGTVPADVATENYTKRGRSMQIDGEHMQLAYRSLTVLDQLLTEAENNAQVREQELRRPPVSPRDTPVVPIAANWISEESDLARQARMVNARDVTIAKNASIMAARNSARRVQSGAAELQFYRGAKAATKKAGPTRSTRAHPSITKKQVGDYQIVADLPGVDARNRAWASARGALASFQIGDFRKAQSLGKTALEAADRVKIDKPEIAFDIRKLRRFAANTAAAASSRLGDKASAESLRAIAISNGSPKAQRLKI